MSLGTTALLFAQNPFSLFYSVLLLLLYQPTPTLYLQALSFFLSQVIDTLDTLFFQHEQHAFKDHFSPSNTSQPEPRVSAREVRMGRQAEEKYMNIAVFMRATEMKKREKKRQREREK